MIAVVDYGMGNLRSVEKALEKVGAQDVRVTGSPATIRNAAAVVLPGVGAFGEAIRRLTNGRLIDPIVRAISDGKPFLGICLGLQLLFERSEEDPGSKGLGVLKGPVIRFRFPKNAGEKIPHMGWNTLQKTKKMRSSYLTGITSTDYFYFVHSYFPVPQESDCIAATTLYGTPFCSVASRGSLIATQFHPEKSGVQGLRILKNFVREEKRCS